VRLVVGMTGASGVVIAVRLLEELRRLEVETHLVVSRWGLATLAAETDWPASRVRSLASYSYPPDDFFAPIASGSFQVRGMVVVPCSMKTLAAVAHGLTDDLVTRAADVALKERRPLVLVPRETPLNAIHLENMLKLARLGATVLPPVPAFWNRPSSVDEVVDYFVGKILDQFGLEHDLYRRWDQAAKELRRPAEKDGDG